MDERPIMWDAANRKHLGEDHPERGELERPGDDQEDCRRGEAPLRLEREGPHEEHDRHGGEHEDDEEDDLRGEPLGLAELSRREELEVPAGAVLRADVRHPEQGRRQDREADDPRQEKVDVAELPDRDRRPRRVHDRGLRQRITVLEHLHHGESDRQEPRHFLHSKRHQWHRVWLRSQ